MESESCTVDARAIRVEGRTNLSLMKLREALVASSDACTGSPTGSSLHKYFCSCNLEDSHKENSGLATSNIYKDHRSQRELNRST
jgi:hypothetical protein